MTEQVSDHERLFSLLAMLPWQYDADGLFPPEALRSLLLDSDSGPISRWMSLADVASELLDVDRAAAGAEVVLVLAMRVLDTFEPLDVDVANVLGTLLPVTSAGRLWIEDVSTTAWRIVSSIHGGRRLAELQHQQQRSH